MRLLHSAKDTSAQFDDPNLVSCAGLTVEAEAKPKRRTRKKATAEG